MSDENVSILNAGKVATSSVTLNRPRGVGCHIWLSKCILRSQAGSHTTSPFVKTTMSEEGDVTDDTLTPLDVTLDKIGMGYYQWSLLGLCGFGRLILKVARPARLR